MNWRILNKVGPNYTYWMYGINRQMGQRLPQQFFFYKDDVNRRFSNTFLRENVQVS